MNYIYELPDKQTKIILAENVIRHMFSCIQHSKYCPESGGQVFSQNPNEINVLIDKISGPYSSDKQARYTWIPDITLMARDRDKLFEVNYFVVGLWHTHPEKVPHSSSQDKSTCAKHLKLLESVYKGFLLITLGNADDKPVISVEYLERRTSKWHQLLKLE